MSSTTIVFVGLIFLVAGAITTLIVALLAIQAKRREREADRNMHRADYQSWLKRNKRGK